MPCLLTPAWSLQRFLTLQRSNNPNMGSHGSRKHGVSEHQWSPRRREDVLYLQFHHWPMTRHEGTVWKHAAKEICWEAKLAHWEREMVNSITLRADWNVKEAKRSCSWIGMRGLMRSGALWKVLYTGHPKSIHSASCFHFSLHSKSL